MVENTEEAIKNGQSRETGNIGCTRWKKHHYTQANTNKTWALLQTTGAKDEPKW